jgi:hypothetical protein
MTKTDTCVTTYLKDGRRLALLNTYTNKALCIYTDYYFDWSRNMIIHCNSLHGIVYLEQPVDFLECHDTDRKRLTYVSCTVGMGQRSSNQELVKSIVYRDQDNLFALYSSHTLVHMKCHVHLSRYEHERVNVEYTMHDNVQTIHNKARTAAIILASLVANPQPRRTFPIF